MLLNDPQIRKALIKKLENQSIKPRAIIEELRVHNGNAIADVVALYKEAHCYEIKGFSDKVERVEKQGLYYNQSFRKITLVTTENHLNKALDILPHYWGIILAQYNGKKITFSYIRKTKNNTEFSKKLAALMLWKSEMLNLVNDDKYKRKPRDFLAQLISHSKKKEELSGQISQILFDRKLNQRAMQCYQECD